MEKEEIKRTRKQRKQGVISQKMVNFRCDLDNLEILNQVNNKGRYINDSIRFYYRLKKKIDCK